MWYLTEKRREEECGEESRVEERRWSRGRRPQCEDAWSRGVLYSTLHERVCAEQSNQSRVSRYLVYGTTNPVESLFYASTRFVLRSEQSESAKAILIKLN